MNAIEFIGVTKRFGGKTVLDGLTFSVAKGEIFVIVGPSGTGKSVALKHIVGLIEPDAGEVKTASPRIGYLFQSGALLAWMTIADNVALPLRETTRMKEDEIGAKVSDALAAVGLSDAADKYPSEISGGMQKRAGLARAIVRETDIVLYDEPTSGLDPVTSLSITNLIAEVNAKRGITSVVVTHDLASALKIASRIMLLKDGKAVVCETPAGFVASKNPYAAEYVAASKGEKA
jgi:phospholipid/cholesterol/gamma-HCH transport system ATP-binding protein